jgi:diacylglycerol kinase family enzyme
MDADQLTALLERVGITVAQSLLVSDLDRTQPLGALWRDRAYDLVIAAGGDGTVGSVATQLAGSGVPLAILPMGTANDVARSLHMSMDVQEACVAIAGALPMDIDIGQVLPGLSKPGAYSAAHDDAALTDEPSPLAGVCFLHAATLGLNVEFARLATDTQRRERLGSLTYAASALEAVTHYRPVDVTLRVFGLEGANDATETVMQSRVVQVSIVNTPVFGGRMSVRLPDVSVRDQQLDFMLIEAVDAQQLRHTVQRLIAGISGASDSPDSAVLPHIPGVRRFRATGAIIETDTIMDVTLDGEIRTHTPVFVRVAPQQLRVLVAPQAKYLLMQDKPSGGTGGTGDALK